MDVESTNAKMSRCVTISAKRNGPALLTAISILMLLLPSQAPELHAQGPAPGGWSRPVDLAAGRPGRSFYPTILSDAAGGVHVFWDEAIKDEWGTEILSVDYAYWDGEIWSGPIDVFVGAADWEIVWGAQAVIDGDGMMHTVWIDSLSLKYAQRHVSSPVSARSWTGKMTLATTTGRIGPTAIAIDDLGILHILYLEIGAKQQGVYYIRSLDGGETWELPVMISDPETVWSPAIQRYLFDLLPVGDVLHAAWAPTDSNDLSYAQSLDHGKEWTAPRLLLEDGGWPNLVTMDDGRLLLLATGTLPSDINDLCFKLQHTSWNGGASWDLHKILMPHIKGCLGLINVMRAYDGSYHLITSAYRPITLDRGGIYYSEWYGEDWSVPQRVVGPGMTVHSLGTQIDFPNTTISEGNILHVVFHVDEGRIWYMRRQLASPPAPLLSYPAPTTANSLPTPIADTASEAESVIVATSPGTLQPTSALTGTSVPREVSRSDSQLFVVESEMFPIVISFVASGVVVGIMLALSLARRRSG